MIEKIAIGKSSECTGEDERELLMGGIFDQKGECVMGL